jgi:hypothetical protein
MSFLDDSYIEAILELSENADRARVEEWLARRGLRAMPMRAGLLVTGDRASFEAAFGATIAGAEPPVRLNVPPELADVVESATIPPVRKIT